MLKKQPNHVFLTTGEGSSEKRKSTTHSLFAKFLQPEQIFTDEL